MSTTRTITAIAVTLAAGLVLGACGAQEAPPTPPPPGDTGVGETEDTGETEVQTPAPEEAEVPAEVGAEITDTEIVAACTGGGESLVIYGDDEGQCPLEKGQLAYTLEDGTSVLVDREDDLPAPVQAEVESKVTSDITYVEQGSAATLADLAAEVGTSTGKGLVVVVQVKGARIGCDSGPRQTIYAPVATSGYVSADACPAYATPEAALDAAQRWAANNGAVVVPFQG